MEETAVVWPISFIQQAFHVKGDESLQENGNSIVIPESSFALVLGRFRCSRIMT